MMNELKWNILWKISFNGEVPSDKRNISNSEIVSIQIGTSGGVQFTDIFPH